MSVAGYSDALALPSALPSNREIAVWGTAAALVIAAHAVAAYYLSDLGPAEMPVMATEQSMEVELSPVEISTPDAVQSESLAAEEPVETAEPVEETTELAEALPETVPETPPETLTETPPPEDAVPVETAEAVEAEPLETVTPEDVQPETAKVPPEEVTPVEPVEDVAEAPPVEEVPPEPVETLVAEEEFPATPDVAVPLPAARPEPPRQVAEERPRPRTERPRREQPTRQAQRRTEPAPARQQRTAPARSEASQAQRAARAPTVSPARWQGQVQARINRFKRTPRGASDGGTVQVRFSINASGSITSARVSRSSGDPVLDQAAVSIVQRASPVPAPPDGVNVRTLTVPIRFDL